MTYSTQDMETGSQRGFRWVKIDGEENTRKAFYCIFAPEVDIPAEIRLDQGQYKCEQGFHPFEDGYPTDGLHYRDTASFRKMDLPEWLDTYVEPPKNCLITVENDIYKGCIRLHAKTFKRGRVETVSRKIDGKLDPIPQLIEIYGYFARNCPAPTADELRLVSISYIGQSILRILKKDAIDLFRKWHETNEADEHEQSKRGYPSLSIDDVLIRAGNIKKVTFSRETTHRQILVEITFYDDHIYEEDDKGSTTHIKGNYAETILTGAKGRTLDAFIGIPGADKSTIRSARMVPPPSNPGIMLLRSTLENVALEIPEAKEDTDEEVIKDLEELIGPGRYFCEADSTLIHYLEAFPPRTLREILSLLRSEQCVDLSDYGGPDVRIKSPGKKISQDYATPTALRSPSEIYGKTA